MGLADTQFYGRNPSAHSSERDVIDRGRQVPPWTWLSARRATRLVTESDHSAIPIRFPSSSTAQWRRNQPDFLSHSLLHNPLGRPYKNAVNFLGAVTTTATRGLP